MSSGWIRLDKDLRGDPRVLALADWYMDALVQRLTEAIVKSVPDDPRRETLLQCVPDLIRDALAPSRVTLALGSLASLWMYADSYLLKGNSLNLPLEKLALLCDVPVEFLQHLPPEWMQSDPKGKATLPDYIDKNSLDSREVRRAKTRLRTKRYRARIAAVNPRGGKTTPKQPAAAQRVTLGASQCDAPPASTYQDLDQYQYLDQKKKTQECIHPVEIGDARDSHRDHENFEILKRAYPEFSGRQDWIIAERSALQRIELDGVTWGELHRSVERYAAYCAAGGVSGPQYVMTPGKFLSAPDRPWQQGWAPPPGKGEVRRDTNIKAGLDWLAQQDGKHER